MLLVHASVNHSGDIPIVDNSVPLLVTSCGKYKLVKEKSIHIERREGRPDFQVLYVSSGMIWCKLNGEKKILKAGDAVIYHPNQYQEYGYFLKDNPEVYWVHFTGSEAYSYLGEIETVDSVCHIGNHYRITFLFDNIILELQRKQQCFNDVVASYMRTLLLLMKRFISDNRNDKLSSKNYYVEKTVQMIHNEYSSDISLEEFSKQNGISSSWLTRIFHQQMGISPQNYITSTRINVACELLGSTSIPISEISYQVGYSNQHYFSRIFRKVKGCTPTEFRTRYLRQK